ncbi:TPA: helix-turn-helix transcriptional regulator, partial [Staphylococcus pseudintermedius]|nr:helix-turn-helix transcriptional regulator [Staphylococcus pseudintermedius]
MIKNKLSELLSERGLKTSRVAKDVGIARSSLTSMIYNDNEMLRYDSIDKLCRYLNITPTDFFEFVPMDIDMVAENTFQILNFVSTDNLMDLAETIRFISLECELLIDIEYKNEKSSFDCIVFLEKISYEGANNKFIFK